MRGRGGLWYASEMAFLPPGFGCFPVSGCIEHPRVDAAPSRRPSIHVQALGKWGSLLEPRLLTLPFLVDALFSLCPSFERLPKLTVCNTI